MMSTINTYGGFHRPYPQVRMLPPERPQENADDELDSLLVSAISFSYDSVNASFTREKKLFKERVVVSQLLLPQDKDPPAAAAPCPRGSGDGTDSWFGSEVPAKEHLGAETFQRPEDLLADSLAMDSPSASQHQRQLSRHRSLWRLSTSVFYDITLWCI